MKIHVVGCPRNPSTNKRPIESFAMVPYYLTTYLHRRGHEVYYYGYKESNVECTKKFICADKKHLKKYYKYNNKKNGHSDIQDFGHSDKGNLIYHQNAYKYLKENCKANEPIICTWSGMVEYIYKQSRYFNYFNKVIDGHVGHHWPIINCHYTVYASYANKHYNYGKFYKERIEYRYVDAVIYPMANEIKNFTYRKKKKDYFLFYGRLLKMKGVGLYLDLARQFPNKKFIIAGQGIFKGGILNDGFRFKMPHNIEFVGLLDLKNRKKYLSNATAVISPSEYCEPFGLTAIEAGLSGTPIIATDHGGYHETIINGYNGFRCSYYSEFVDAINNIDTIKSENCRKHAKRFTAEELVKDWEKYLKNVVKENWYSPYKKPE